METNIDKILLEGGVISPNYFSWGNGNVLAFAKLETEPEFKQNNIFVYKWDTCDDIDNHVLESFASEYYQFTLKKNHLATVENEENKRDSLITYIKELNFSYTNILKKAAQKLEKENQDKAAEYYKFYLLWALADISLMSEHLKPSKTQEFCRLTKQFPDIKQAYDSLRGGWEKLFLCLSLGEFEHVNDILKGVRSQRTFENYDYAIQDVISLLKKKIKFFRGDDNSFQNMNDFRVYFENQQQMIRTASLKLSSLDFSPEFNKLLEVINGNVSAIKDITKGDWRLALNLYFMFIDPTIEKSKIKSFLSQINPDYLEDTDCQYFLSVLLNKRALEFLSVIINSFPMWFIFHMSSLLFIFKKTPPPTEKFYDKTFMDYTTMQFLEYLASSQANFNIIKYYILDPFEEPVPAREFENFLENIYSIRMIETSDEAIAAYLEELKHDIFQAYPNLVKILKNSLRKRWGMQYFKAEFTLSNIKKAIDILSDLEDESSFLDKLAIHLVNEYDENSLQFDPIINIETSTSISKTQIEDNSQFKKHIIDNLIEYMEANNPKLFEISEKFNFFRHYCKFKKYLRLKDNIGEDQIGDAKSSLRRMIINGDAPKFLHLTILNDSLDLFEMDQAKFNISEIYEYLDTINEVEENIKFNSSLAEEKTTAQFINGIKLVLVRSLSKCLGRREQLTISQYKKKERNSTIIGQVRILSETNKLFS